MSVRVRFKGTMILNDTTSHVELLTRVIELIEEIEQVGNKTNAEYVMVDAIEELDQ